MQQETTAPVTPPGTDIQHREEKIEEFIRETAHVIATAEYDAREELREYAVSLLRSETEPSEAARLAPVPGQRKAAFNPLVLAIPLFLIGVLLLMLFPTVGILMLLGAVVSGAWGILRPLFYRETKRLRK